MRKLIGSLKDGLGFDLILIGLPITFLLALAGLPLAYNVLISFQDVDIFSLGTTFRPFVGLSNYEAVVNLPEYWVIVRNTVIYVTATMGGQFVIGFSLALFFMQKFPGASIIRGLFLVSWVMPGLVIGAIWSWILAGDAGILNVGLEAIGVIDGPVFWRSDPAFSLWSVVIASIWAGVAFNMLLLSVGLAAIPKDIYEAADLDGANAFQRFWTITLPMMRSTIGAVLALGLIFTLQQFDLFAALTGGGPANTSSVAGYWAWQMSFELLDFAKGASISVMLFVLVLFAAVVYVRSTRGEVRG